MRTQKTCRGFLIYSLNWQLRGAKGVDFEEIQRVKAQASLFQECVCKRGYITKNSLLLVNKQERKQNSSTEPIELPGTPVGSEPPSVSVGKKRKDQ